MPASELAARLQGEIVAAMKAKEKDRLRVLRMMQAAVKQVEVDERRELDDADVLKVLVSYGRRVKDQAEGAKASGRENLMAEAEAEWAIVAEFLPAELSDDELAAAVREAVAESGAEGPKDMGKVMKAVMPKVAGRADGGRVSALVKQILAGG